MVGSQSSIFLGSTASSDCLPFVWRLHSRSSIPFATGIGLSLSTFRTPTSRSLSIWTLGGISGSVLVRTPTSFGPFALVCRLLRKHLLVSWPRSPQLCTIAAAGFFVTSTTGSSLDLPRGDCAGEGLLIVTLRRTLCFSQSREEFSRSYSDHRLPRNVAPVHSFEGFPDAGEDPEGSLSGLRVCLLARAAATALAVPLGGHVV